MKIQRPPDLTTRIFHLRAPFHFFLYNNVPRAHIVRKVKSEKKRGREMGEGGMFCFSVDHASAAMNKI